MGVALGAGSGVADRLLGEVATWAVSAGARTLRLGVLAGNERAIALYERHGYVAVGRVGDEVTGEVTDEIVMVKRLSG